jgi:ribose transport system permease protein
MDPLNQPIIFLKEILRPKNKLGASIKHRRFEWINRQELIVFMLLLAAIVFFSLSTNTFLTANNLQNVSRNFAWITIPAFGESLVIIVGGIDLSVGAVMALSGLITALALRFGLPIPLALVLGLLSGGIVGWINGTLVGRVRFPPFIVTLGTASIVRGIIFGLAEGWPIRDLPSDFRFLGQANVYVGPLAIPVPLLITIILAVLVYIILSKTVLGRYIFSLGDNEQALIVTGVGLPGLKTIVYTLCGALTAVGGILMTARLGVAAPTAATGYELNIIAAAIIGGTSLFGGEGSTLGVLLGAAFMQILLNGLVLLGLPTYWQSAALGSMIFLGLLLDLWRQNRNPS